MPSLDPHSDYLGHVQMESLAIAMNLSLFGIGASLDSVDGYTKIRELIPGGPAARSGQLKPGDRIMAVAQAGKEPVDIVDMPLSHAVELIRGPKGSSVTLTVIPATLMADNPSRRSRASFMSKSDLSKRSYRFFSLGMLCCMQPLLYRSSPCRVPLPVRRGDRKHDPRPAPAGGSFGTQ